MWINLELKLFVSYYFLYKHNYENNKKEAISTLQTLHNPTLPPQTAFELNRSRIDVPGPGLTGMRP